NFDRLFPIGLDVFKAKSPGDATSQLLRDLLVPSGSQTTCVSDYSVYDMAGNIDEWVKTETSQGYLTGLKGGHYWHVRNASRPTTTAHDGRVFAWYETG